MLTSRARGALGGVARRLSFISPIYEPPSMADVDPPVLGDVAGFGSTTLPSGLTVCARGTPGGPAALVLSVKAGTRYEPAPGGAFMLQQLAFKGTTERSALRTIRSLENLGALASSSLSREAMTYSVTCLQSDVEAALELLATCALTPDLGPEAVADNAASAAADAAAAMASPMVVLSEMLHEAAFGEASPLGKPVFVTAGVDPSAAAAHHSSTFTAGAMTLAVSGMDVESAASLASCYLHGAAAGPAPAATPSPFVGGFARLKATCPATYVGLGFPSAGTPAQVVMAEAAAAVAGTAAAAEATAYAGGEGLAAITAVGPSGSAPVGALVCGLRAVASGEAAAAIEGAKVRQALKATTALEGSASFAAAAAGAGGADPSALAAALLGVGAEEVQAAAAAALQGPLAYALVGDTRGAPSHAEVADMLKA